MSRLGRCLGALLAVVVLAGCSSLPDSGPVHRSRLDDGSSDDAPAYVTPPGPADGAAPSDIARGFVDAMEANPLSTSVARSYLTDGAKANWKPNLGTIIYEARTAVQVGPGKVSVRLSGAERLDPRGGWLGGPQGRTRTISFRLVRQHGQWRIDNPPDALIVDSTYFTAQFAPFDLYFFDQTGKVLVPDIVYIPRGEQTATNLVHGLLAGPGASLAPVVRNAFPARTDLDGLSVVVSDNGTAEVPLSSSMLRLSPAELNRAVVQLAWTLRQVPGISQVRITVDGAPIPLVDGSTDFSVNIGAAFNPVSSGDSSLFALREDKLVRLVSGTVQPLGGPFGKAGYSLRTVASSRDGKSVAAVAVNGRTVFVGPSSGSNQGAHTVLDDGTDVLRPAYDMFGDLWLLDRTSRGAVVHVIGAGSDRVIRFPGISGRAVTSFTVSADGTQLVATMASKANPVVEIADIVRNDTGSVTSTTPARTLPVSGSDLGPAIDIGWVTPTELAVLAGAPSSASRVIYVPEDGSPGDPTAAVPNSFNGKAVELATTMNPALPVYLVSTEHKLYQLDTTGRWATSPIATGVAAASYGG